MDRPSFAALFVLLLAAGCRPASPSPPAAASEVRTRLPDGIDPVNSDDADAPVASRPAQESRDAPQEDDEDTLLAKRRASRLAAAAAAKKAEEDLAKKIDEVTVIPRGASMPKKSSQACDQVADAMAGFVKRFYPGVDEAALVTQLALIEKQCNVLGNIEVAMCQKFALEATTVDLKRSINEYLPACMGKYGAN